MALVKFYLFVLFLCKNEISNLIIKKPVFEIGYQKPKIEYWVSKFQFEYKGMN
nr:MAG TPA: hypothetical protein [Caudoviricetes sp.]